MEEKVKRFIMKNNLLKPNSTIIVGVSGGPDSLALLHYLWVNRESQSWVVIAAHVDHMFRGQESADDMRFVIQFCLEREITFEATQINVREYQEENGLSSQVAARECRFSFFQEVMRKYKADYVAVAQHGDDQIETVLMRLVRGGTNKSIAGIHSKRPFGAGFIVRPFLSLTKKEILQYCENHSLQPRIDPSNQKGIYTRNRFRNEIVPFLKMENPNVHVAFQQFSEQLLEDEYVLEELTKEKMNTVIKKREIDYIEISIDMFLALPISLQRRSLHLILNYLYETRPSSLSNIHIEQVFKLLKSNQPSGSLHFPNSLFVNRSYQTCMFTFKKEKILTYEYPLQKEDKIQLPNGDVLWSELHSDYPSKLSNDLFVLPSEKIEFPLTVRTRKQGDKLELKGMKGTKKIKDIFIDEKVPLVDRETWPIVVDNEGTILWLPGLKKSRHESAREESSLYAILFYQRH
ncbi:tRNA lysidine(34) synthetase TilS [Bacillus salitolerans]|uniref:tRNA(Ile)-lysidine synthase n=1 Tax=Bacillus salitolerans TaxID=1437434 RepID=A0ABW4LQZ8_9BACI